MFPGCLCVFFATPWTVASQAPLFMEFSRQEYLSVSNAWATSASMLACCVRSQSCSFRVCTWAREDHVSSATFRAAQVYAPGLRSGAKVTPIPAPLSLPPEDEDRVSKHKDEDPGKCQVHETRTSLQ